MDDDVRKRSIRAPEDPAGERLDERLRSLRRHIAEEDAPERLLALARELEAALSARTPDKSE